MTASSEREFDYAHGVLAAGCRRYVSAVRACAALFYSPREGPLRRALQASHGGRASPQGRAPALLHFESGARAGSRALVRCDDGASSLCVGCRQRAAVGGVTAGDACGRRQKDAHASSSSQHTRRGQRRAWYGTYTSTIAFCQLPFANILHYSSTHTQNPALAPTHILTS